MPQKLGIEKLVFKPFENESALECICRLQSPEEEIGVFLLREGNRFCLRFGFRLTGIHPLMSPEQVEAVLRRLEAGAGIPSRGKSANPFSFLCE